MKQIKVHFKTRNGETETVECPEYNTVMEASKYYSRASYIESIDAECGGACACATCHVLIDRNWIHIIGQPNLDSAETDLIEYEKGYDRMQSRLACQIQLEKKHDGLVAHLLDNHKL